MVVTPRRTGLEAAALRQARRMSIRAYDAHLGIAPATVANWDSRGQLARLNTETQHGHSTLAAAYGYDITHDPAWPLLQQARELKMIAAAVPLLASAPGVAAEFQLRLASVRNADYSVRWTSFGDLSR